MPIHIAPVVCTVRWYEMEGGFDRYDPFICSATLQHLDGESVFLSALEAAGVSLTRRMLAELAEALTAIGIKRLYCVRHGRRKMYTVNEFGSIVKSTPDWYD